MIISFAWIWEIDFAFFRLDIKKEDWHEKWKRDIFLHIKNNMGQINGTAKSFFVLEINLLQVSDDVTDGV